MEWTSSLRRRGALEDPARLTGLDFTECNPGLPQNSNQLRCASSVIPTHHSQYRSPRQEEPYYPPTKWCEFSKPPSQKFANELIVFLGIVSAPLWDSHTSTFAGLLTTSDYINVVQYYWQNPDALSQIDQFRLSSLRGRAYVTCR
jgi:hypothetical protein